MTRRLPRREFIQTVTAASAATGLLSAAGPAAAGPNAAGEAKRWYRHAYRRAVIDMHIPDWDPKFLSQFDPDEYAKMLVRSKSQSIVCYCQSHVGLFNYPTKIGKEHAAFKGRNMLQEMIDRCHAAGINVQLYTSLIFDRWCADQHPEWRIRTVDGRIQGEGGRFGVLCVNSPYREYVRSFVKEICETFDFEGIRFDMTFWPSVCYCRFCKNRYAAEVGGKIPEIVNWLDARWVAFQRARERWLVEFATVATSTVRQHKPQATVEHQSSTYPAPWTLGVTTPLARQNDFLQGDFYGSKLQGSFVRKLLEDLTPNRPFGYETSFSVALNDHTAMKTEELLEAKASAAIADHAAFIFIDAIDPIGTVNARAHERMGRIFERLMPYYQHLGGERVADVAAYYSTESKFTFAGNGRDVRQADLGDTHSPGVMGAASRLIAAHVPFRVITKPSLGKLGRIRLLILSNVNMMDDEECAAIRAWVKNGGTLYASGSTSLVDKAGKRHDDFMLADVFGVSLKAKPDWNARIHYLAPTPAGQPFFPGFTAKYPAYTKEFGLVIQAAAGARVLATTTLPWPASSPDKFASIHSDPPWVPTDNPELVDHNFGQGRCIYAASMIENLDTLRPTFDAIVSSLCPKHPFEVDAPGSVEASLFDQPDRSRYILSLVNFQEELPNIPISDIRIRLRLPAKVKAIRVLPSGQELKVERNADVVFFNAPRLTTLSMFAIEVV